MSYTGSCVAAGDCDFTGDCDTSCQSQSIFKLMSSDIGDLGKQPDKTERGDGSELMF